MSEAIFVQGLTKSYNGKTVVDHLDLSVSGGTVFGLLGANGAGKSTTIECILGTKLADSGTVRLLGQNPKKRRRQLFQRIGVQFQEGNYHPEIRVSELCEETASLYRAPADWRKLCGQFRIGDKANAAVKSLSGGERQRLFSLHRPGHPLLPLGVNPSAARHSVRHMAGAFPEKAMQRTLVYDFLLIPVKKSPIPATAGMGLFFFAAFVTWPEMSPPEIAGRYGRWCSPPSGSAG